jgi:tRNA(fMet)-specific endonuclease VapC
MRSILLDTNAYTAFKQGHQDIIDILRHADLIGISTIVLGELIAGFTFGSKTKKNLSELQAFLNTPRVKIIAIDENTASFYGRIYTFLRHKGKPIPTNDLWISATTLQHGFKLCSFDSHFSTVDNLIVITTLEEFLT